MKVDDDDDDGGMEASRGLQGNDEHPRRRVGISSLGEVGICPSESPDSPN